MSGEFPEDWFRPVEPPETPSVAQEPAEGATADSADFDPAALGVGEGHGTDPAVALEMDLSLPDDQSTGSTLDARGDSVPADSVPGGAPPEDTVPEGSTSGSSARQTSVGEQSADVTENSSDLSSADSSSVTSAPPTEVTEDEVTPAVPSSAADGRRGAIPPTGPEPGVIPVIASPGSLVVGKVEGDEDYQPAGTRLHPVGLAVVAIVLSLAVGLSLGLVILNQTAPPDEPTASPSVVASSSVSATPAQQPYTGSISQLPITSVTSSCATEQSDDGVSYPATAVSDNNPETAWRCNGDGVGQTLTLTVDHSFQLAAVGIVNGYAKSNGSISYYKQFRRIIRVTWTLPDGSYFLQYLSDNTTSVQRVMIPLTTVDGPITVRIDASSAPGDPAATNRDAVLISTIQLWTVAG